MFLYFYIFVYQSNIVTAQLLVYCSEITVSTDVCSCVQMMSETRKILQQIWCGAAPSGAGVSCEKIGLLSLWSKSQ